MVNLDDLKKQETRPGRMRAGHKTQASIVLLQDDSDVQIQLPTSTRTRIIWLVYRPNSLLITQAQARGMIIDTTFPAIEDPVG